ncbi:MAG: DNA repair protein RecN [Rhodospirillales bacterium]
MLTTLSIRDVVLIGRLDLFFEAGLSVLTGETGAGKSILLDSLGLVLGMRADARLLRHGTEQASVTAAFDLAPDHVVLARLKELGTAGDDGELVLRRVLGKDGRSKAFINDQPVSVQLLREIGDDLVEVHGQFENQRLLKEAAHRPLLDSYGGLGYTVEKVKDAYAEWTLATKTLEQVVAVLETALSDRDYLSHALDELKALDPQAGEEKDLASKRLLMMNAEKLLEAMNAAATALGGDGAQAKLDTALGHLERVADKADGRLAETIEALSRALSEAAEADALLQGVAASLEMDPNALETSEERLFALRAQARKHNVAVDDLARLMDDLHAQVQAIEDGDAHLAQLAVLEKKARAAYIQAAEKLTGQRQKAAAKMDKAMAGELAPLKLDKAKFSTIIEALSEDGWGPHGLDKVAFQVATNPGAPPGPLGKISSGGELARFMLALKAVLAGADPVPTLVFDEVDSGVGGAVAAAVGERLAGLAAGSQVLVVTHSPQVAARGEHHWRVSKSDKGPAVLTTVAPLDAAARKEEIARMLAGAKVTDEARAAADSLLESAGP